MRKLVSGERPLYWVGSAKRDLLTLPAAVKDGTGTALSIAQFAGKHPAAKPWKWLGTGVLEGVENHDGKAHRPFTPYAFVRLSMFCIVFRRSLTGGIQTPTAEVELASQRATPATLDYEDRYGKTDDAK